MNVFVPRKGGRPKLSEEERRQKNLESKKRYNDKNKERSNNLRLSNYYIRHQRLPGDKAVYERIKEFLPPEFILERLKEQQKRDQQLESSITLKKEE